eukprot:TRINITY_DN3321_c0_g1_i1.p1 TRINITY_DN3321_c0_g1~~TRINITY_DN3321_c0_g1_i1.p1  ORF type:complete len:122 (+),score=17.71 TRINITY_DN3321_c0_g1_i1:136-501(+)
MLGMSPELHVVILILDTLCDNETVVMNGAIRVGKHTGYGLDVKYVGDAPPAQWTNRSIIAMDAQCFVDESDEWSPYAELQQMQKQVTLSSLQRELHKAYCGFRPLKSIPNFGGVIETGNWG